MTEALKFLSKLVPILAIMGTIVISTWTFIRSLKDVVESKVDSIEYKIDANMKVFNSEIKAQNQRLDDLMTFLMSKKK